jgi:hypothetical protein
MMQRMCDVAMTAVLISHEKRRLNATRPRARDCGAHENRVALIAETIWSEKFEPIPVF